MIGPECQSTLAGHSLAAAPVRVIMTTVLWCAAALTFHEWCLEVRS